jgi:acetyl esterase/lipase
MSRSVLTRWAPGPDETVRYGPEPDQVIDVRRPAGGPVRGLVVFFHGGFWRAEYDRMHVRPLAVALARAGYVVATPEFRRTGDPGGGWPGTIDDAVAAGEAVVGLVGADLRPVLAGHSAGGHLALLAAAAMAAAGHPPAGVLGLAPVSNLVDAYERDLDAGAVRALLGGGPDDVPDRYAAADPMARLPLGVPQVVIHGHNDAVVPLEMSRTYAAAADAAGDPMRLIEIADADHFDLIDPESPVWPEVMAIITSL